jgi:hypothetical protein
VRQLEGRFFQRLLTFLEKVSSYGPLGDAMIKESVMVVSDRQPGRNDSQNTEFLRPYRQEIFLSFRLLAIKPLDQPAGLDLADQTGLDEISRVGAAGTRVTFAHLSYREF